MNIKQYMREGKDAMNVLFNEEQIDEGQSGSGNFKYYDDLPLPKGHVITYTNPENGLSTNYMVDKVISQEGSCSITYLMEGATLQDKKVMKEFRPRFYGIHRCMIKDAQGNSAVYKKKTEDGKKGVTYQDYQLDYDIKDDRIGMAKDKFKREPERVKLLETNPMGVENQARAMHLPRFHSYSFEFHGNLYYLLDYVEGVSLFEYVKSKGKSILWEQKVSIMEQLCIALNHLHKECVHMDITPYNIMVKENEDGSIHLTLIDFGLATSIIHNPQWGSLHDQGTPCFTDTASHNQLYKKIHDIEKQPAPILVLDIYSVGMIWLYLLHAHLFQNVDKGSMQNLLMDTIKRNLVINKQNAKERWMKHSLQLACDSISYDDTRISDEALYEDCYGPFWQRPKTVEDWYGRLTVINKEKEPYIKFGCEALLVMPANKKDKEIELTFETNGDWIADCDAKWLKGWKSKGEGGEQTLRLTAEPNLNETPLGTKLKVTAKVDQKEVTKEMPIVQPGCGIVLLDNQSFEFRADGEKKLLKFKAGSTCTCSWKENKLDWVEKGQLKNQNGLYVLELNANKNNTQHIQEAVLEINCCGNLKEVVFTQPKQKQEPFVKLPTDEPLLFPANDGKKNVGLEFETNGDWSIECSGPWCIVSNPSGKAGKQEVQLAAKPNLKLQEIEGEITIKATLDGQKIDRKVKCLQPGCGIEIEPKPTVNFPASGKVGELRFRAGGKCNVDVKGKGGGWLVVKDITTDENGWQVILLEAGQNTDTVKQYADVCIECCGYKKSLRFVQDVYILQSIHKARFKKDQNTCFDAGKGTALYHLSVEATGPWTARLENNPDWVKIRNEKGVGDGMLELEVKKNTSIYARNDVRLVVALDNGKDSDFVKLSQKGSTDIPFDWKALWQKVRIPVCALVVAGLAWGGYMIGWSWMPALQIEDELHKTLPYDATGTGWDFDAKDAWTAEVVDGAWVTVGQREGEAGSHHLDVQFNGNRIWAERSATIRLTCQDKSELLTIKQGYNRVDSLNDVLTKYRELYESKKDVDYSGITSKLDKTDYRGVFRTVDGSYIGNNLYAIQGKYENCRIGDTHKVVDFKQNAESLITEIIVAPINE